MCSAPPWPGARVASKNIRVRVRTPKPKAPRVARVKVKHPPWAIMITNAVKALGGKGGSSVAAIKKYLRINYKVDDKMAGPFLKRGMNAAITSGKVVQVKGHGLTGSFKLGGEKKPATKKTLKRSKVATKKSTGGKKAAFPKKKSDGSAKLKNLKTVDISARVAPPPVAPKKTPTQAKSPKAKKPKAAKATSPKKSTTKTKKTVAKPKSQKLA